MVRIVEITLNSDMRVWEYLINNVAATAEQEYDRISSSTDNFIYKAYEIMSPETIADELELFTNLSIAVSAYFNEESQTHAIVTHLVDYFKNS